MSKVPSRTRSVGTDTRGDDATTASGRRKIEDTKHMSIRRTSSSAQIDGARSARDNQKNDENSPKDAKVTRTLEDKKTRRAKRSGYDHAAAKSSNPDMLEMPAGGMSDSMAGALKQRLCPFGHKEAAAGVPCDKMNKVAWIGDKTPKTIMPVYFPQQSKNPINHADPVANHIQERDKTQIQGSAGVTTSRLTNLQATWITDKKEKKKEQSNMHAATADHIFNTASGPPDKINRGLRHFDQTALYDRVQIAHHGGRPEQMMPEEVTKWFKLKQVRIRGGQFQYNVAGQEDLLPAATQAHDKADRPPSANHRAQNDKRYLPKFYRRLPPGQGPKQKIEESEDMAFIMGQDTDSGLGLSARQSMVSMQSEEGYFRPHSSRAVQQNLKRSQSARIPASDSGNSFREYESYRRSATPPPRGYAPPSDSNASYRSATPPPRFSPPARSARSQGSGSVYSADSRSRQVWSDPTQLTRETLQQRER